MASSTETELKWEPGPAAKGAGSLSKAISQTTERARVAGEAGIYLLGEVMIGEARIRAPLDRGALQNSGYVTLPQREGGESLVEMGFGGPADPYAVRQHENQTYKHPEKGEAKFLERAIAMHSGNAKAVADWAAAAFERGDTGVQASSSAPQRPDNPAAMEAAKRPSRRRKKGEGVGE